MALLLGYDVGSSSVKATLMDSQTSEVIASAISPEKELQITAKQTGWAEQNPDVWWQHVIKATNEIKSASKQDIAEVQAIGISYQMHGLVVVDKNKQLIRDSIIWCDSRAVKTGEKAAQEIGHEKCLKNLLNLPGNFTASRLKWVRDNEPQTYSKIYKMMLPGDFIAMKMTGQIQTTVSGLSECILWDFQKQCLADLLLEHYGIDKELIADVVPIFSVHGEMTKEAANELGLKAGTKISYRAGDQPNNALSLNVLNPGEIATTAGTSGVVYGVTDKANYDSQSRVNIFTHVNYKPELPRYGVLLCVSGTGILNSWLKHNTGTTDYDEMDKLAEKAPVGSEDLFILPYGNGAERTLVNRNLGASIHGLHFNIHDRSHLLRAAQEGIVFALNYGLDIMSQMGIKLKTARAGFANMFLSPLFAQAFATLTGTTVELYNTDGSQGAARGAGIGAGIYKDISDAFAGLKPVKTIEPNDKLKASYKEAYKKWKDIVNHELRKDS